MLTLTGAHDSTGRTIDVVADRERVIWVGEAGSATPRGDHVDLTGYLLTGAFSDPHVHLDKVFTFSQVQTHNGTLSAAMERFGGLLTSMDRADIKTRAQRALRYLVRHGTTLVRSHVGCGRLLGLRAVEALAEVREEGRDVVDLELVAHIGPPPQGETWRQHRRLLEAALDAGADLVGGNPSIEDDPVAALNVCFEVATERGVGVDFHIDESTDATPSMLSALAELASQATVPVTASHCVSLGQLDEARAAELSTRVAEAGIDVVTLPATNLFLQGRGMTPVPRGMTALGALSAAGVRISAGSDNSLDPFNPTGRLDPLQTASLMVVAGHQEPETAWQMISGNPRQMMGREPADVLEGAVSDLVAIRAGDRAEALALAPLDRVVIKGGRVVSRTSVTEVGELECLS